MRNNIILENETKLIKRINLREIFKFGAYYDHTLKGRNILFCEGDLLVKGNLDLDYDGFMSKTPSNLIHILQSIEMKKTDQSVDALVVLGNLTVHGSVLNSNSNAGVSLYVLGTLKAHNLVAGGTFITVGGDIFIEECTYCHYNDGHLMAEGTLHTPIYINLDHSVDSEVSSQYSFDWDEDELPEDNDGNQLIPKKLKKLIRSDITLWDDIFDNLIDGKYMMKDSIYAEKIVPDQAYYDKMIADFIEKEKKDPCDILRRVPKEFRSQEICNKIVAYLPYNIQYVPSTLVTKELCYIVIQHEDVAPSLMGSIPMKFRTRELCMLAAKNRAISVEDVPEKLLNDEELLLEIVKNFAYAYTNLSEKYLLKDEFMIAAICGGEYSYVKYTFEGLEQHHSNENISYKILCKVVEMDINYLEQIPGYAFTKELYEFAKNLYGQLAEWQEIERKHSIDFWRYVFNDTYVMKVEKEITHDARYTDAFKHVWLCFWTEEFIMNCLKYCKPRVDFEYIPKWFFTDNIVKVALEKDSYGYYRDYLDTYGLYRKYIESMLGKK